MDDPWSPQACLQGAIEPNATPRRAGYIAAAGLRTPAGGDRENPPLISNISINKF